MSAAVSPYLHTSQNFGLPNGQQADLLDALLASCQKSAMNPRLSGYGRSLQPYFTTDALSTSPESAAFRGTPPCIPKPGRQSKARGRKTSASPSSSSDEESNQKHTDRSAQPVAKSQMAFVTHKAQTIKAIHNQQKIEPHVGNVWAGPSFGVAPAASEIPVPSDFLLV